MHPFIAVIEQECPKVVDQNNRKRLKDQTSSKKLSPKHYQEKESQEQKLARLTGLVSRW
ncbi:hypothetical protein [Winogradskyella sp. J14-2]|uniref:hypothetical protein n=1 Tax=Winogradskyella sp. J14-2 TaxID=1936080 RepID=UPI0012FCB114|nr:hypothetical protein [Winogradskyella sp. J14-2]